MMQNTKSSNTLVMRKSDKATNNSHNFKSGQNQNVVTSKFRSGNNGKSSFFGARRNTLTTNSTITNSSGFNSHRNISSGVHQQQKPKWQNKNRSQEESVISASSCSNSNNTLDNKQNEKYHQPKMNNKLKSVDSMNTGCGSSQTSGHHSQDRNRSHTKSTESFDLKDVKNEINKVIDDNKEDVLDLNQIQEAKPGNKRALLVDLPPYLYSIPALASFFEPYGEVAMLQILPQKRMWDADLIDLLGASMCNKLANQSLCAVVEFYSARMAKFIIGILRKRLPILKFRCALLKPSAAIELTNQAENLGLNGVVVMKNKPVAKNTISTDSGRENSHESDNEDHSEHINHRRSELESGCEDVSSSDNTRQNNNNNRLPSYAEMSESESEHSPSDSANEVEQQQTKPEGQRFVTSFSINLGR